MNGELQNTVIDTFPKVSQFWKYSPAEYCASRSMRDFPDEQKNQAERPLSKREVDRRSSALENCHVTVREPGRGAVSFVESTSNERRTHANVRQTSVRE